ncbi:V-type ATPase subunit [Hutsoniella sourekii]
MTHPVDYGMVNITIRYREANLLKLADYQQLLHAANLEEALDILASKGNYAQFVESIRQGHSVTQALMKALISEYNWALTSAPDPFPVELLALKYVYHNLKLLFKERVTGNSWPDLYIPLDLYRRTTLEQAIQLLASDELPEHYLESIRAVSRHYQEYQNPQMIDMIFDQGYYQHLHYLAQLIDDTNLMKFVEIEIDLENLKVLGRFIHQEKPANLLLAMLTEGGSLKPSEIVRAYRQGAQGVVNFYQNTEYHSLVPQVDVFSQPFQLEQAIDDYQMKQLQAIKIVPFGPAPLVSYLLAKETENQNLRIVLQGIENGLDRELLANTLRLTFVDENK